MRRRTFLKALGACAATAPGALWAMGPEEVSMVRPDLPEIPGVGRRPNVILVLCDDLGWGDLGLFWQNGRSGEPHIDTPNLDAAMRRGVMLTQAYTTAPVCAPARASMVTGKHQGHCNLRDNMFDRPIDAHMTLGTVMKRAGYATWHVGKWGIGGGYESGGVPRRAMACDAGFDYSYGYPAHAHGHSFYHWESANWRTSKTGSPLVENVSAAAYKDGRYAQLSAGAEGMAFEQDEEGTYWRRLVANAEVRYCYDTDLFTAKIKQLIKAHQEAGRSEPFFCYACYTTVHGSGSQNSQGDTTLASVENFHVPGCAYPALDEADTNWGGGVTWEKDDGGRLPFKEINADGGNTSNTYIHPDYQAYDSVSKRRYATNVRRLDDALGDLLNFLRVRGLEENTLFIFTSDNGPAGEYLSPAGITWVQNAFDSNGPFKGMKRWSYEGGLREPTFAVWPGVIPAADGETPRTCAFPFQFPAWMATLADVAGLPQPAHCDGVSLLPSLTGVGRQLPMRIYTEYSDGGSGQSFGFEQMVRDGDYVLIRNRGVDGTVELYDVAHDEGQTNDLSGAPEQAHRVRWMSDLLLTCRIPSAKVPASCGAISAHAQSPAALDEFPLPATPCAGRLPPWEVRLFLKGAANWPWVPNFRTLVPDVGFLADDASAMRARLPDAEAFGLSVRGWLEVEEDSEVLFSAEGAGGCQLWLHEAHVLEYEAGDCSEGRSISFSLAKGRHPFRLWLTSTQGVAGLCKVAAGSLTLA